MSYGILKTARHVAVGLAIMAMLASCSCMHNGAGNAAPPENPEHVCPPCPPCPGDETPPSDPLADSELDDGLTGDERTEFIRRNVAATVRLHVIRYTRGKGLTYHSGTGAVIDDRHVLTAAHVVRNAEYVRATIRRLDDDGVSIRDISTVPMRVVARDADTHPDIALLEVKYQDRFVDTMPVAPRGYRVRTDDLLWHFGMTTRWQRGRALGRIRPDDRRVNVRNMVEIDCLVQPGDSGGPVVTPDGRLVGTILRRDEGRRTGFFVTLDDGLDALLRILRRPIR